MRTLADVTCHFILIFWVVTVLKPHYIPQWFDLGVTHLFPETVHLPLLPPCKIGLKVSPVLLTDDLFDLEDGHEGVGHPGLYLSDYFFLGRKNFTLFFVKRQSLNRTMELSRKVSRLILSRSRLIRLFTFSNTFFMTRKYCWQEQALIGTNLTREGKFCIWWTRWQGLQGCTPAVPGRTWKETLCFQFCSSTSCSPGSQRRLQLGRYSTPDYFCSGNVRALSASGKPAPSEQQIRDTFCPRNCWSGRLRTIYIPGFIQRRELEIGISETYNKVGRPQLNLPDGLGVEEGPKIGLLPLFGTQSFFVEGHHLPSHWITLKKLMTCHSCMGYRLRVSW